MFSNVLGNGLENDLGNGWRNGSGMVLEVVWGLVQGWFWKWFRNGLGIGLENPLRINSWCLNLHRFSLESLNSQIFALFFVPFLLITIECLSNLTLFGRLVEYILEILYSKEEGFR